MTGREPVAKGEPLEPQRLETPEPPELRNPRNPRNPRSFGNSASLSSAQLTNGLQRRYFDPMPPF